MPDRVVPLIAALVLLWLGCTGAARAETVTVDRDGIALGSRLSMLVDPEGMLTLDDVTTGAAAGRFAPTDKETPTFARTRKTYWARVTLRNPTDQPIHRLLVLNHPYHRAFDLFVTAPDGQRTSRHVREGEADRGTDIRHRFPVFRITLPPGDTTLLMRGQNFFVTFALDLRTPEVQSTVDRRDGLLHGVTFGIFAIVAAYQAALVVMARVSAGLPLLVYASIVLVFIFVQLGYPYDLLPPGLASRAHLFMAGNWPVLAGHVFAMVFLELRRTQRWAWWVLMAVNVVLVASYPLMFVDPAAATGTAQLVTILAQLVVLAAVLRLVRRSVDARFFLLGFFPIMGVAVLWALRSGGALPVNSWTEGSLFGPNAVGMVLFTFGVAYRIGRERATRQEALTRSEAELRLAKEELEQRVEQRTAELRQSLETLRRSQEALVQSEKMASLGQLVAGVAHEINTPVGITLTTASHLNEITGELEAKVREQTLKRSELSQFVLEAREATRLMVANISRASTLIQSFKQVSADQSSEERRRVNLGAYLEEVVESLGPALKRAGHGMTVACPPETGLDTYPGLLAQVVTNFVSNSIVHAYSPGVKGTITLSVARLPGGGVEVTYRDDGKGIPAEVLPRIFDPFFTTRRGTGGTGLGLHIVFNLVTHRLKGSIQAFSAPGEGTRFVLRLPDLASGGEGEAARDAQKEAVGFQA
ncbi:MAG TPA: ATP-binding protein [Azospirillaceae bacterium]|nr:ATP-binding protein [Azospirillaceae bacterium]